jgi:hypothetical protein
VSYRVVCEEIEAVAGTTAAVALVSTTKHVRKAIITHKGTGTNLKIGTTVLGSELFPGQSYTLEPGHTFRFDLATIKTQDAAGATAHDVHVLAWI